MRPLLFFLVIALFLLSALAGEKLPADEQKLYEYGTSHMNGNQWRDAERAFEAYLERHPEGKWAEQSAFYLGQLNLSYARRYERAREQFSRFCSRYPKSEWYWHARFMIAQSYSNQQLKAKALDAYRAISKECPEVNFRTSAANYVFSLQDKYLRPYVGKTFTAGAQPELQVSSRNVPDAELRLYRVPVADVVERMGADGIQAAIDKVALKRLELVKKWRELLWRPKQGYHNTTVKLPVTDAGLYRVEIEHDGVTFTVTIVVNRLGLVTKQAADSMVVFAQDRVDGTPVPGMHVRAFHSDGVAEGKTDEHGLVRFYLESRAFVVGDKDGEYAFSSTHAGGWSEKQSLFYVFTDRPIYRPDQQVRFKIVHRVEASGALTVQEGLKLKVLVNDQRGNRVHEGEYALNRFGTCAGEFKLGAEPSLGTYQVHVQPLAETAPSQGWWGFGLHNFGQFRVDEYRKPEFKVDVAFDEPRYIQGDTLKGSIHADYYFGSPVPNATVRYRIFKRVHWSYWGYRHAWAEWYGDEESARWYGGYGQEVKNGTGKTDAQGRLAFEFETPREKNHDVYYTVEAQVTDLGRRRITGSSGVLATQAEFGLQVHTDRYVVLPKQPFKLTLRARTHGGEPVAGQGVAVRVFHRRWDGNDYQENEVYSAEKLITNEQGEIATPLEIPKEGYMRVEASATDRRGNDVKASRYIWIASAHWGGSTMNFQGLDIVPDKESYQPGDTATFLLTSQEKDIALLFTVEGDKIHEYRVVRLNGHTATVQVKLDRPAFIPNVYVTATALHGGQLFQKNKSVTVDPADRFLTVEIQPSQKQYRPREAASFQITTRDKNGRPVSAEVALGVVDESLYALQPELAADIRRFFVRKRWNRVQSGSSLRFWDYGHVRGSAAAPHSEAAGEDREEGKGLLAGRREAPKKKADRQMAATEIRARFADTMLWMPTVETDADGRATVEIQKLADNLTTWRVTARGITTSGLVGQEKEAVLVRKNIIVRLQTPRYFTQGDKSFVTAVIRNDLDEAKDVKVEVDANGVELDGKKQFTVHVPSKGEKRIDWTAFVGSPGTARITVKALTDTESDAMRLDLPVLPHGSLQWTSSAGLVEEDVTERFTMPEGSEGAELLVSVSPTHAATVLDALDYLAGYPYGCVEQTMSRFLPTAITRQVLRQLDIAKPDLEEELPRMLQTGLQRLYNFQHGDGGWGWWRNDQSNPFTTAYVVYGLAQAQEADVLVRPDVLQRGIQALRAQLKTADNDETRAYVLYALSVAGQQDKSVRNALADRLKNLPAAQKAMLALVLKKDGENDEAKRVLATLLDEAVEVGAGAHWRGASTYRWTGHAVETTAIALQAMLAIDPQHALVKKVVTWLAMTRDGNHWVSTRQTAMVVYALAGYLKLTGEREPDMTLTLAVNGAQMFDARVTKDNWATFEGTVKIAGSRLRTGENTITIQKRGTGTPVFAYYLKRFQSADKFEASQGGLRVERAYALVSRDEKGQRHLEPLTDGAKVESGDEIEVTLTVRADREHRYLMIEDPMPAGFEANREPRRQWYGRHWNYWYANKEYRDEKVDIAVTYLPQGEQKVSYVMRAETPGTFRILPTLVWNMYRPGEGGNSGGMTIHVVDNG